MVGKRSIVEEGGRGAATTVFRLAFHGKMSVVIEAGLRFGFHRHESGFAHGWLYVWCVRACNERMMLYAWPQLVRIAIFCQWNKQLPDDRNRNLTKFDRLPIGAIHDFYAFASWKKLGFLLLIATDGFVIRKLKKRSEVKEENDCRGIMWRTLFDEVFPNWLNYINGCLRENEKWWGF